MGNGVSVGVRLYEVEDGVDSDSSQVEVVLILGEAAPGFTRAQSSAKLKSPETIIKGGGVRLSCLHRRC